MNPALLMGLAAAAGVGVAIATRKRNAAATWHAEYWRRVHGGQAPQQALEAMLGSLVDLPSPSFISQRARFLVDRGRQGRGWNRDDPYMGRADPHLGLDIVAATGTQVRAAKTGIVTYAENRIAGFGRMIWVSHLETDNESTLYAHLDGFNCGLGELVAGGAVIGYVGNTCAPEGTVPPCWCRQQARCAALGQETRTMGAHCHFEVHARRIPVTDDNVAMHRDAVAWLEDAGINPVGEVV